MAYEEFQSKRSRPSRGSTLSITPQRTIILSRDCHEQFFKDCNSVIFFYDPERNYIGLKPLKENQERAHGNRITRKSSNMFVVTANAFLNHHRIDYSEKRSYEPTWNEAEGLVEIDLNKPL